VNVGASNVNIHVLRDGSSAFTRDIGMGGRQFTEEIQRTLNISYEEAEAMKVGGEERDTEAVVPGEVTRVMILVGDNLATEIHRSLDFYLSTSSDAGLSRIYLSGGAARTPGRSDLEVRTSVRGRRPFRNIRSTSGT
jgi:type IV pilus assembly protein PilM